MFFRWEKQNITPSKKGLKLNDKWYTMINGIRMKMDGTMAMARSMRQEVCISMHKEKIKEKSKEKI